jgi:hypothetical protein
MKVPEGQNSLILAFERHSLDKYLRCMTCKWINWSVGLEADLAFVQLSN